MRRGGRGVIVKRAARRSWKALVALGLCAAGLVPAAPTLAAGTVVVTVGGHGTTVRIQGDAADNAIDVRISGGDLTVVGGAGTIVENGVVSLARAASLVIDMRQGGNDSVRVLPAVGIPALNLPTLDASVTTGNGNDTVTLDSIGFLSLKLRTNGGDDTAVVHSFVVEDFAIFDGGPGVDDARMSVMYNLPFQVRGFETLWR